MRKGRRKAWLVWGLVLLGTTASADPLRRESPVRLTVEIAWSLPELPALPAAPTAPLVILQPTEGRVIEAIAWPVAATDEPASQADGAWRLGHGRSGRVRARVEAPIGEALRVEAGGQVFVFPIISVLEGPQQTVPNALAEVTVRRLDWDALEVRHDGNGTTAPGGSWPVTVGFNILTPVSDEVALRFSAELRPVRGGEPVWSVDQGEVVTTNSPRPTTLALRIPAPPIEGTYVLETRATWGPIEGRERTLLGHWLRRRRGPPPTVTQRRVTLAVVGPGPVPMVDGEEPGRSRAVRPLAVGRGPGGLGRAPWPLPESALMADATGVDRLKGLIPRVANETAALGPADDAGLAWASFPLRVTHPGRPHRLVVTVAGGPPSALGVALIAPGERPRVLLDACASGPGVAPGDGPATFAWPVWPDATEPVVVVFNRDPSAPVRLGAIELTELATDLPPHPPAEVHPDAPRHVALSLAGTHALDRFGGDPLEQGRNLSAYLAHCGASAVVLPDGLADRPRRLLLEGQAAEDPAGPDRLDMVLRVLRRRGLSALIEAHFDGPLPGLPAPDSAEALARGLVRVDHRGQADGPAYQPLRPEVREAMRRTVEAAITPRRSHPNLLGVIIRLGPGCTLPGGPEVGLDDGTYGQFVRAALRPEVARDAPSPEATDAERFAARRRYLAEAGATPWLAWRAREIGALYAELAAAASRAAPGAVLAVASPVLDAGPAGTEARRHDAAGRPADHAWRAVGLDLKLWPTGGDAPIVLRGTCPTTDDLARDLAVDPDLDAQVAARPTRGLWWLGGEIGPRSESSKEEKRGDASGPRPANPGPRLANLASAAVPLLSAHPMPPGPLGDEPLGHALAVLDARWVVLAAEAVAGREERVSRCARVVRALPAPAESAPPAPRLDSGVAARSWSKTGRTYLALANDTPYTVRIETHLPVPAEVPVIDLGRGLSLAFVAAPKGGRQVVLELEPFGVAALRVDRAEVRPSAVLAHLPKDQHGPKSHYLALRDLMDRLGQGGVAAGPPNPSFEPSRAPVAEIKGGRAAATLAGWSAGGDPANVLELDPGRPHAGRGSLRLDARALPAFAASDPFAPPAGSSLTLRAWLRADRPETPVRVRLDGLTAGQPVTRRAELTVGPDWREATLRFEDLPPGGLDRARLRFEPLAAGRLWLDDLGLTGQGPSETEKQARLALTAALHAFDESRYADFARLAGSRRVRWLDPSTPNDPAGAVRTSRSSDLPAGRRLR